MWEKQWARVQRSFSLVEETHNGRAHQRGSDYYLDELYHFFEDCDHLKDWLKNDPSSGVSRAQIRSLTKESKNPSLRLCALVSNGAKHLNPDAHVGETRHSLTLGSPGTYSARYTIEVDGRKVDAFDLAVACMDEWKTFLHSGGLARA